MYENWNVRTDCNRDGVRWARVDVDLAAVAFRDDVTVKNIILQFDDLYPCDACIEGVEYILQKIMGERAYHFNFLQGNRNGFCFVGADPDRKITLRVRLLEH